jgi:hypothetical protein
MFADRTLKNPESTHGSHSLPVPGIPILNKHYHKTG